MTTMTVPSLTRHDLQQRKDRITATDVAAIMGTSPWKTKYDVWIEKCLDMEPIVPSPAMLWGSLMEDDIITYAEARLREHFDDPSIKATRVGVRRKHANGIMSATLDSVLQGRDEAIEAKTHAVCHPNVNWDEWGTDEFGDTIPVYYRDQVCAQFACAPNLNRIWVVLSIGRMVPTIYCLERENLLARIAEIETACCDFWDHHILTNIAPAGEATLETVKRVKQTIDPSTIASIDDALCERQKELAAAITAATKQKEQVDASLRLAMLGAERGRSPKGHFVHIGPVNVKGYSVAPKSYQRMTVTLAK